MDESKNDEQQLLFPPFEYKVQSPFLYLQSVGSTGDDGSVYGAHLRWLLLRNLGESHLPKADYARTTLNFNREDDYVKLFRSRYEERFPLVVDFSIVPDVINDEIAFWIYKDASTDTVVYIRFRDGARYAAVRAVVNPSARPLEFVRQYCPGLIEAEVKDKLCFAVEFDIKRDPLTVMRAELLSVESNEPLSALSVSCRKTFTDENWCPQEEELVVPSCCGGPNMLSNGDFENEPGEFGFETDYQFQGASVPGVINVTSNAQLLNGHWRGLPHSGTKFLAADGITTPNKAVIRFRQDVEPETEYCFTGWLALLNISDIARNMQFRFTSNDGRVQSFEQLTPGGVNIWEQFTFFWDSGAATAVTVEIISLSIASGGNDFGIDDLCFCKRKEEETECHARMMSENIRVVRLDVTGGYPRKLEFETYDQYLAGAIWESLGSMALTTDEETAFNRLEPVPDSINGQWRKYNDDARLRVWNYQDRWQREGGLSRGVQRYIELSDDDPLALDLLESERTEDGSIEVSMLDMLRMLSLDFHIARMLGLGYLDRNIMSATDEYIYLCMYDTEGALDDTHSARPVRHYYMGIPTRPLDHRLPDAPRLKDVTYGLTVDNGEEQLTHLTDERGYTLDGLSRYINLFVEPEETDETAPGQFFVPPVEFCAVEKTASVFYGIEYRMQGEADWRRQEIAHDLFYQDLDDPPNFETLPLPNNADPEKPNAENPILRHKESESGIHEYGCYAINWFSRVSPVGNIVSTDDTLITKANRLLPPSNFAVQLIQKESPLMLTTSAEQSLLMKLIEEDRDRTLVRVTFEYNHAQDLSYDFADTVELFFRSEMPRNVVGALKSVSDDPADAHKSIIRTTGFTMNSQGVTIHPTLDPELFQNFVGGVFSCKQENYIITDISPSSVSGEGPVFTVQKNAKGTPNATSPKGAYVTVQEYIAPSLDPNSQVMFMAVENMADDASWGMPNPLSKTITIGDSTWTTHTETYEQDGENITIKLRGVVSQATINVPEEDVPPGVYRIDFTAYMLPHHPQFTEADPSDWYKGVVRAPTLGNRDVLRKSLEVFRIENLGDEVEPLVLYVIDNAYNEQDPNENVITDERVTVNYYPGYKFYLFAEPEHDFTEATIQASEGEGNRRTWLGARACDNRQAYYSDVGIPAPIVALEFVEPFPPGKPAGGEFATRPDYYYKSSYTFRLDFEHKPYAVVMYRADDEAVLRALYSNVTYDAIIQQLEMLGDDDPYRWDRWRNLLSFDYVYDDPQRPYYDPTGSNPNGTFRKFPAEDGYAFPNPDKEDVFDGSTPGSVIAELKQAVWGAFTSLTELPLIYSFIKGPSYVPVPKPQNIRNAQGRLLDPGDPAFDIAPMAKRTGNGLEIQFTDFTLDGTSTNIFFYYGREIGNRGRLGQPGPIAGPVRLINTRPPDSPGVKKMYIRERNLVTNTEPVVNFEVNAYPVVQKVGRMLVYRASNAADALSVRTMQLVKTVDFAESNQIGEQTILLSDDFESGFVPYGDPLFYRIVALRKVENPEGEIEWSPSQSSKLLLTTMIDAVNPEAPEITYTSDGLSENPARLTGVILSWPATVYNGIYYLDKMNVAGNWVMLYSVKTNEDVTVNLAATDLGTNVLLKENEENDLPVYHRFRVRVENSSGLFSLTDKVLTI